MRGHFSLTPFRGAFPTLTYEIRPDSETTDMGSTLGGVLAVFKAGVVGMNVIARMFIIPKLDFIQFLKGGPEEI